MTVQQEPDMNAVSMSPHRLIVTLMPFMLSFGRDLMEKEYGTQGNTGAFPCPVDQLPLTGRLAMPRFLPPSSITSSIGTTC